MKVYVAGSDSLVEDMFITRGWEVVSTVKEADLVQFTGGADVDPSLYGETPHPTTYSTPGRDAQDKMVWMEAVSRNVPCVGICRGGQLMHVLNGGKMYQDVDGHALHGTHLMFDLYDSDQTGIEVTSTHHQQMRTPDSEVGMLIATAEPMCTYKEHMYEDQVVNSEVDADVEVVFYPNTRTLCYQPHPEYLPKEHPCQVYYFKLLDELLWVKQDF